MKYSIGGNKSAAISLRPVLDSLGGKDWPKQCSTLKLGQLNSLNRAIANGMPSYFESFLNSHSPKTKNLKAKSQGKAAGKPKKADSNKKTEVINLDMPGFQRLESVLQIIPVSRAAWYAGVAEGRYPPGVQIGKRSVAWSNASLKKLIDDLSAQSSVTYDTS
jgi:predicted DNA-binding transcriptional regulator AlpA